MNNAFENERKLIAEKIKHHHSKSTNELGKLREMFSFLDSAPEKFNSGSYDLKKLILQTVGSNFVLNNEKVCVELSKGFSLLQKAREQFTSKNRWVEPNVSRSTRDLKSVNRDDSFVWSAWWIELRTYLVENEMIIPKI